MSFYVPHESVCYSAIISWRVTHFASPTPNETFLRRVSRIDRDA